MNLRIAPHTPFQATVARISFFCCALTIAAALLSFCPRQASATIYYVNPITGSNTNTGKSWATAFADPQVAFTATFSGDQVWIAQGTYYHPASEPNGGTFSPNSNTTVYGGFAGTETSPSQRTVAAHPTIFNGLFDSPDYTLIATSPSAGEAVTLDGITIEGAYTYISGPKQDYPQGPTALVNDGSGTLVLNDCLVSGNDTLAFLGAQTFGGAIYSQGPIVLTNCTLSGNGSAGYGGALYAVGAATVTDCFFTDNISGAEDGPVNPITGGGGSDGAAIYAGTVTIKDCTFSNNAVAYGSGYGGGVAASFGTITGCTFIGNIPDAIDLEYAGSAASPVLIKDNLVIGTGPSGPGGIDLAAEPSNTGAQPYATITNNTIIDTALGIADYSTGGSIAIANNILSGTQGGVFNANLPGPAFTFSHNDFFGNATGNSSGIAPGTTDLFDDPQFNVPAIGDYRLRRTSPLVNAGNDSYVAAGDTDLFGNPRINGNHVDIGAYEYYDASAITSFSPTSGPVGTAVTITGTNLSGVSLLGFMGKHAASFTVNASGTQITTTVPAGAVTGPIAILAPGGEYKSATSFAVTAH